MRTPVLWAISRRFHRLLPGCGQVAHVLRTLPPVAARSVATPALPLDLHVLSLPLAFILSQDQTLLCIFFFFVYSFSQLDPTYSSSRNRRSRLLYLGTCLYLSFSIFNDLVPSLSERECKGKRLFRLIQIFLKIFNGCPQYHRLSCRETCSPPPPGYASARFRRSGRRRRIQGRR